MIKVSVMYAKGDDVEFDMDYYTSTHMEIVQRTMKPSRWEVESGLDGPYVAIGNLYFDSMEALQGAPTDEAMADVPNFTNVRPAMQVSQLVD